MALLFLSHVNDSGFWLYGKFTGATEGQTLKTWSLMETILGTTGAVVGMIFFAFYKNELFLFNKWRINRCAIFHCYKSPLNLIENS